MSKVQKFFLAVSLIAVSVLVMRIGFNYFTPGDEVDQVRRESLDIKSTGTLEKRQGQLPSTGEVDGEGQMVTKDTRVEVAPSISVTDETSSIPNSNYRLKSPRNFDELNSQNISSFLNKLGLGEGVQFSENVEKYTSPLSSVESISPETKLSLEKFQGRFQSRFVNESVSEDGPSYIIKLVFEKKLLDISIINDGTAYYKFETTSPEKYIRLSLNKAIPENLFITLPSKIEQGYRHPLFIHVFLSEDAETLAAIFYNTNQRSEKADYKSSEQLVFRRTLE